MVTHEHSAEDDSVAVDVVLLVAERTGVEPADLPPIEEAIDPDALDALFASARTGGTQRGYVEFTYYGHHVTVPLDGDRTITVVSEPAAAASDSGRSAP
ncbi:HalOD1 output domain-containing protein [Saliphagus infecundisoli]|uniref:HalOD1 output domain-containing protein n=1 Tax=Saliphagus infecundisoli TaxID=1849069 RepID=A0ABD5QEJ6_9EURY|nr:HalOD1 output domain-containing protein [Saliphagus infecundisoli]